MSTPTLLSRQCVRLATHALPAGPQRSRYQQEFIAELHVMSPQNQRSYAISVLTHAWSLRSALARSSPTKEKAMVKHPPLMCRLNIHHHWHWDHAEDGSRYQRCSSCDKDRSDYPEDDGPSYTGRGTMMPL